MEDHGHGPLDFHVPTKESLTYKCQSSRDYNPLKTQENQCWSSTPSLVTRTRRLVSGPIFEKMRVAQLTHLNPNPIIFPPHLGGFVLIHTRIWWAYMETRPKHPLPVLKTGQLYYWCSFGPGPRPQAVRGPDSKPLMAVVTGYTPLMFKPAPAVQVSVVSDR